MNAWAARPWCLRPQGAQRMSMVRPATRRKTEMSGSVKDLYDGSAPDWMRTRPLVLSDFTGRVPTIALCEPVVGSSVLDLGCGEGYCARELRRRGAREVLGIDVSEKMIEEARAREEAGPLGIEYRAGSATNLQELGEGSFDLVVAVFVFNYLDTDETCQTMSQIFRALRSGGKLVFAVPHPASHSCTGPSSHPFPSTQAATDTSPDGT